VRIQLKRDSWVAVSQLCSDGGDARASVNQRRSDTMPKRMEAREWNPLTACGASRELRFVT
jgi:hypothetical protein